MTFTVVFDRSTYMHGSIFIHYAVIIRAILRCHRLGRRICPWLNSLRIKFSACLYTARWIETRQRWFVLFSVNCTIWPKQLRACAKITWQNWRSDLGRTWPIRLSKTTGIAGYSADFVNEISVKDGLKLRCQNGKLFLRKP